MKRQAGLTILVVFLVLSMLTGCSDSIESPTGSGDSSSGTLTSEQQQNIALEFINAFFTMQLNRQPSGITMSDDYSTLTFTNYALSSYYDTAMSAGSLGTTTYIGSGSIFNGTLLGDYESTTGISTTIANLTITDCAIPGGSVTIVMNLCVDTNTGVINSLTMTINGTSIDTNAVITYINALLDSYSESWLDISFGETGPVEANQNVNTTMSYTLEEDEIHWITFTATSGKTYVLQTKTNNDSGDDLDTVMTLRNPEGVQVATNDDYEDSEGYSLFSKIRFTANSTGTYYIGILDYDCVAGSYQLSITEESR